MEVNELHRDVDIKQLKTYSLFDKVALLLLTEPNIHEKAKSLCLTFDTEYLLQSGSSKSRFSENDELRYSMRSVVKYAPWVRRIFLVTNGQIPHWLNLDTDYVTIITHDQIFANQTHLPTFSSVAIESHLHRIPGLSEHFLYFNDDVILNQPISYYDFVDPVAGYKIYQSWDVPQCSSECPHKWLADGFCDRPCNTVECEFDGGDCDGGKVDKAFRDREPDSQWSMKRHFEDNELKEQCSPECSTMWLGDRFCDSKCNTKKCGYDLGDCGIFNYRNLVELDLNSPTLPSGTNVFYINCTSFNVTEGHVDSKIDLVAILQRQFEIITVLLDPSARAEEVDLNIRLFDDNAWKNFTVARIPSETQFLELSEVDKGIVTGTEEFDWIEEKFLARKLLGFVDLELGENVPTQRVDKFAESLKFVNRLYNHEFGYKARKVIAHMPHMINKNIMSSLQQKFDFEKSSSNRFRSADDMQFAFSYFYYLHENREKVSPEEIFTSLDFDSSGAWSDREIRLFLSKIRTPPVLLEDLTHFETSAKKCGHFVPNNENYFDPEMPPVTLELIKSCPDLENLFEALEPGGKLQYKSVLLEGCGQKF